jgi:hypothetical protein
VAVTVTPIQPSENAIVSVASVNIQVAASTDLAGGSISGGTVSVNGGTALALTFDTTSGQWKRSVSVPLGPVVVKIDMVDSGSNHGLAYRNFSRSTSTSAAAVITIQRPAEGETLHQPGVVLQADVSRTTDIVKVEVSVDKGLSWLPMTIPPSSGGS